MSNNQGTLYNLAWKFGERILAQLISLVVSIILARILSPSDYGTIAVVMIFITLANVFVSDGFGSALIQKKDATAVDFFSVFYFNIIFACVLYAILFFSAPIISNFFGEGYEILVPVLRVLGVRIIFTAVNSVQHAYVAKHMMFRLFFISTLWGTCLSAIIGILMAYKGYGVWALVAQYMSSTIVSSIALAIVMRKRPRLLFSFKSLKSLFPFGARILGTGLLITGYMELRAIIIGKLYSSSDLAFYDRGRQFPNLIVTNISTSISSVLFPKMSLQQDNPSVIKQTTRQSIRVSAYVMCPLMMGLAAVADSFVNIVLTDKWAPCVPLLRLFCIIYLFQPIHAANMQAIKAIGRGDIYMNLEIIKKVFEFIVLLAVMRLSVQAIVVSMAICSSLFIFVNMYPNVKLLDYQIKEQIKDLAPSLLMSIILFCVVYLFGLIPMNNVALLTLQIMLGIIVYLSLSILTKNEEYTYMKNLILNFVKQS